MSVTNVTAFPRAALVEAVGPLTQTTTASTVAVTSSGIDARSWRSVCYTIVVATNAVKWSVWGANASDYSDEVAVQSAATVASGAASSYSVAQAPFGYYRVKVIDDSGGVHGDVTVYGIAKG